VWSVSVGSTQELTPVQKILKSIVYLLSFGYSVRREELRLRHWDISGNGRKRNVSRWKPILEDICKNAADP
jgi:hypothetical protein